MFLIRLFLILLNEYLVVIIFTKLEKLPQAFMLIGWMESDFRNLTAKIRANVDYPIKNYLFLSSFD